MRDTSSHLFNILLEFFLEYEYVLSPIHILYFFYDNTACVFMIFGYHNLRYICFNISTQNIRYDFFNSCSVAHITLEYLDLIMPSFCPLHSKLVLMVLNFIHDKLSNNIFYQVNNDRIYPLRIWRRVLFLGYTLM